MVWWSARGDARDGRRRTFVWTPNRGLEQLPVPDEFHPSDVDNAGNVLGNINSHPWQQPGIYEMATQKYLGLPSAYNHQTSVKATNNKGLILGQAQGASTRHLHPLIWRLRQ